MSRRCAFKCLAVCVVAVAGCSSRSAERPEVAVATTATASVGTACEGFEQRYVGGGLTVDLPADVNQVSGEATADPGPVHGGETHDFPVDSSMVTVGRIIGSEMASEPSVSERVSDGVVFYVRASSDELRSCLLASMHYDQAEDLADG